MAQLHNSLANSPQFVGFCLVIHFSKFMKFNRSTRRLFMEQNNKKSVWPGLLQENHTRYDNSVVKWLTYKLYLHCAHCQPAVGGQWNHVSNICFCSHVIPPVLRCLLCIRIFKLTYCDRVMSIVFFHILRVIFNYSPDDAHTQTCQCLLLLYVFRLHACARIFGCQLILSLICISLFLAWSCFR